MKTLLKYILCFCAMLEFTDVSAQDTIVSSKQDTTKHAQKTASEIPGFLQNSLQNSIALSVGLGSHALVYKNSELSANGGFGVNFKVDYTYKFTEKWGVSSGLMYGYFSTKTPIDKAFNEPSVDIENHNFQLLTSIKGEEKQQFQSLSIPLMANYETPINDKMNLVAKAGFLFNIPIRSTYQIKSARLTRSAFFPQYNLLLDDAPELGYGVYTNFGNTGKISTKFNVATTFEVGINLFTNRKISPIYVGIYGDLGLTSMLKTSSQNLFDRKQDYQGILNSNLVEKAVIRNFGIKISIPILEI